MHRNVSDSRNTPGVFYMKIEKGQFVNIHLDDDPNGDFHKVLECLVSGDTKIDTDIYFDLYGQGTKYSIDVNRCGEIMTKEEYPEYYL